MLFGGWSSTARVAEQCRVLVPEWTVAPAMGGKHWVVVEALAFVLHLRLGSETSGRVGTSSSARLSVLLLKEKH